LMACLGVAASWLWFIKQLSTPHSHPFQPPEMAAAQFSRGVVVGDLGGMPVAIPRHFAEYVEYDGDPGWGETRKAIPLHTTPIRR
jgi:hypothetical protein